MACLQAYTLCALSYRMIAQLKQLKERIEKIDAATQAKQAFLDGLRQEVATIEDATKALQQYMGAPVTAQLNRQHEANQLSAPLYSLFCELEAYQIASDSSKQMGLTIVDAKPIQTISSTLAKKKRSFPSALQNGSSSANATDSDKASKRLKGASRSPSAAPTSSVATIQPASDASRVPPSRSPSVLRNKALLSLESGEVVSTGTAEKLLALRPYEEESSGVADGEAMDVDASNNTACNDGEDSELRSKQERQDLWEPNEKALLLTLSLSIEGESPEGSVTTSSFSILFQYLPVAKIVTAEVIKSQPVVHTTNQNLLTNLFPGDDGLEIPRLACNYEFMETRSSQYGKEAAFPADATCRPFYWAQWICGLHPAKRLSGDDNSMAKRRPEPSVRSVMNQLVKRLVTSIHVKKQLEMLLKASASSTAATDVVFVHSAVKALFPGDIKTHLESWKEIPTPTQDIFQLFKDQAERSNFHLPTHGCRYYRVAFKNERARMSAIIEISPEYPVRAPRFIFQPKTATSSKMENGQLATYENQLKVRMCALVGCDESGN